MKFEPVNVEGKEIIEALRDIARGVNQTHQCVHAGHEAQAERDRIADEKRAQLAETLGKVQAQQELDGGRITALAKAIGTEAVEKGEAKPTAKVGMGWKEHLKLAGTIGASLTLIVFGYRLLVALAPAFHEFMLKVQT